MGNAEILKELRARIDLVDARSQGIERMTLRFQAACQSEAVNPVGMGLIPSYLRNRLDHIEAARLDDVKHRLELQRRIEELLENRKAHNNMSPVFNVGDIVTHRCGNGPRMVVCQIIADPYVRCRWFSKDDLKFIVDEFQGDELKSDNS